LLVAGGWFVLREKYCWLVADKPSEQGGDQEVDGTLFQTPSTPSARIKQFLDSFPSRMVRSLFVWLVADGWC
jgi:hypothetical protein